MLWRTLNVIGTVLRVVINDEYSCARPLAAVAHGIYELANCIANEYELSIFL
jgi:hypothetical protein